MSRWHPIESPAPPPGPEPEWVSWLNYFSTKYAKQARRGTLARQRLRRYLNEEFHRDEDFRLAVLTVLDLHRGDLMDRGSDSERWLAVRALLEDRAANYYKATRKNPLLL